MKEIIFLIINLFFWKYTEELNKCSNDLTGMSLCLVHYICLYNDSLYSGFFDNLFSNSNLYLIYVYLIDFMSCQNANSNELLECKIWKMFFLVNKTVCFKQYVHLAYLRLIWLHWLSLKRLPVHHSSKWYENPSEVY